MLLIGFCCNALSVREVTVINKDPVAIKTASNAVELFCYLFVVSPRHDLIANDLVKLSQCSEFCMNLHHSTDITMSTDLYIIILSISYAVPALEGPEH